MKVTLSCLSCQQRKKMIWLAHLVRSLKQSSPELEKAYLNTIKITPINTLKHSLRTMFKGTFRH